MGTKKRSDIQRGRDVTKVLQRNGCDVRNGKGSHMVGTLPDGSKVTYYRGELSPGVRRQVVQALAKVGLIVLFWALAFAVGGWLALAL